MTLQPGVFEQFSEVLADSGLHLCAVRPVDSLPDTIWLSQSEFNSGSLLVVGHAGRDFWQAFKRSGYVSPDPVDSFSSDITEQTLQQFFPSIPRKRLFPAEDCLVNLMALGRAFGWHHPSALGMGIHAKYGLWSAYRAVWWLDSTGLTSDGTTQAIASRASRVAPNICAQCETQECISACPGEALLYGNTPNLTRCADFRLEENSACTSTCLARIACPQGAEHRYDTEQMAYHYDLARSAIAKYRKFS